MGDYTEILTNVEVDAVLITDPYNLRYYTGFRGGEGVALISKGSKILITDSRYTEAAGKECEYLFFCFCDHAQQAPQ